MEKSQAEINMFIQLVKGACQHAAMIPVDDLEEAVREFDRWDTLGPILNPTGWMDTHANLDQWQEIFRAFLTFRKVLEKFNPAGETIAKARREARAALELYQEQPAADRSA